MSPWSTLYLLLCMASVIQTVFTECKIYQDTKYYRLVGVGYDYSKEWKYITDIILCTDVSSDLTLSDIDFSALPEYPVTLTIMNSHLTTIPTDSSLSNFGKLNELTLKRSGIEKITSGPFDKLNDLEKLDLSHNDIKEIHSQSFLQNEKLKELYLDYNDLTTLNFTFPNPSRLRRFSASYNNIRHVNSSLVGKSTTHLDLSYNQIERIDDTVFQNGDELEVLDLSYNKLSSISADLSRLPLTFIRLRHNQLTALPKHISYFHLQEYDLSFNKIKTIEANSFKDMYHLDSVSIDLSHNEIERIDPRAFNYVSIYKLNLRHNRLTVLQDNIFVNSKIEYLDFSHNEIENVSSEVLKGIKTLRDISLSDNKLKSIKLDTVSTLCKDFSCPIVIDLRSNDISKDGIETFFNHCHCDCHRILLVVSLDFQSCINIFNGAENINKSSIHGDVCEISKSY